MLRLWKLRKGVVAALLLLFGTALALAEGPQATPSIYAPASTPAAQIQSLSYFVLEITGAIFLVVGGLMAFVCFRYRAGKNDDKSEPAQIYGSTQVELAWTVIPVLIVVVLFLTTARMIFAIQDAPKPKEAVDVTVVGHQFWWEYRYPQLGIVTANELHIPLSSKTDPKPTYFKLLSADVDHSYWVPQLSGKTDLIPNHPNELWMDPLYPGLYKGQCAQFCGAEHALMLLRVYVDTPEQFQAWVANQQKPGVQDPTVAAGRQVFETQACMNCHAVAGTAATGRYGPDLTHLASRDTLASGVIENNPKNLRQWIKDPDSIKPGALMPAMKLSDEQLDQLTAYLATLK
ncbi:cytochrome c oxidase subunit II [Silvibacterium dinghuense]|uniref:Cytochrome c oxidase subunit 2 n=1 Tax=Silvibacterium dinghuense TaxID=1560006 RepID=A0A4Q1SA83_9BACT|nr:cytochrome c oxidase subunit II [Silvibacterium dinghuense]RXS93841.1 cytochrome c oxidase subunit II [Silvibacterium dinghuense]